MPHVSNVPNVPEGKQATSPNAPGVYHALVFLVRLQQSRAVTSVHNVLSMRTLGT